MYLQRTYMQNVEGVLTTQQEEDKRDKEKGL